MKAYSLDLRQPVLEAAISGQHTLAEVAFVDEAGVNTAMTRRFARAPRGERADDSAPRNYGGQTARLINLIINSRARPSRP